MTGSDGLQNAENADSINVGSEFRRIKTDLDVALGSQVVDFIGLYLPDHLDDAHRITKVGIVKMEAGTAFKMGNPFTEIHRTSADDSVNLIPFF